MALAGRTILHDHLPVRAWMDPRTARLPGVSPVDTGQWLWRDERYAEQMRYRDHLINHARSTVYAMMPQAEPAARELRDILITESQYDASGTILTRSDGAAVDTAADEALITAGRLAQEDFCILQPIEGQYCLTGAILCFPSSWRLADKIGRTMTAIHGPVPEFSHVQSSVERMLAAVRPEQPLMRANALIYTDPDLHQPRAEGIAKPIDPSAPRFVRVERQSFRRLAQTRAVVFAIHTFIVPAHTLTQDAHSALAAMKPDLIPEAL